MKIRGNFFPLPILAAIALTCMARAENKWDKEELWDLFRFGKWKTVKAAILKNPKLINQHDPGNQMTPLHGAARFGPPELVLFFIEKGAGMNAVEYNKFTPLHDATTPENVRMLITHGANTTQRDAMGNTPLQKNAEQHFNCPWDKNALPLCEAMLEAGAKLDLLSALYLGRRDEAKKLVAADPALLSADHEPGTNIWHNASPLGIAAAAGDEELVDLFLKNGAPVDDLRPPPAIGMQPPLINALLHRHVEVAELLLKEGASLDMRIGGMQTPELTLLQWADQQPDLKIRELIHRYTDARAKK